MSGVKRLCVITGASRGIGKALCERLLTENPSGVRVVMCVRKTFPFDTLGGRLSQVVLDVSSEQQVQTAAESVKGLLQPDEALTLVNNAGLGDDLAWKKSTDPEAAQRVLGVNLYGLKRVTDAFIPLLSERRGCVVNVSSGAGAQNVGKCREDAQALLLGEMTWEQIDAAATRFTAEYTKAMGEAPGDMPRLSSEGFWMQSYGFSKALVNSYTRLLARTHPELTAHCCTPGFVHTDMCQEYVDANPAATLKTPTEGASVLAFLALGGGSEETEARFYRSPTLIENWVTPA
eukprot:TRINITY_DN52434_c0_g1_i1.p2 TRINITY_DN52434_c0_g1~~TRINITY_DN52434_c0_g1_i1.p2  ORF type:complete len:290 (+),score=130.48 TRINITY_DN52434_c0_g1_i1:72-941(+)